MTAKQYFRKKKMLCEAAGKVANKRSTVSAAAEAGSCHFSICPEKFTSREATVTRSLPLVHSKGVTRTPGLIVEYENAGLPRKTDFLHLPVADEYGIIG
jgi:hypothetical protein